MATEEITRIRYLDDTVYSVILCIYVLWRYMCTDSKYNLSTHKGRIRSLSYFFLLFSIISSLIYTSLIYFMSHKINIDKNMFELIGYFYTKYSFNIFKYTVDLSELLNITYMTSKIFRISSLLMVLRLWFPSKSNFYTEKQFKKIINTSCVSFSRIYSVIRIPVLIYLYYILRNVSQPRIIFIESCVLSCEIYFCLFVLIILKSKNDLLQNKLSTLSLLGFSLFIFGFLNYTLNIINIPFILSNTMNHIRQCLVQVIKFIIDVCLCSILCPLTEQMFDYPMADKKEVEKVERQIVLY